MTPPTPTVLQAVRLRNLGCLLPLLTIKQARAAALPLPLAASLLAQESGGGANVYGHDPTIFVGAGAVTRANYAVYRAQRESSGNRECQGVGPCQLTYWSFQDAADRLGGCWLPAANLAVGFHLLADNVRRYGLRLGVAAYNGSGPAADTYANEVLLRANDFARVLHLPAVAN